MSIANIHFLFIFIILFCINPQKTNSSTCSLDFSQFPYEPHGECFEKPPTHQSCCSSALSSIFQAMSARANQSRTIFLDQAEARDCGAKFQSLHNKTDLSKCGLSSSISSPPASSPCSNDADSVISSIGKERYEALLSNCSALLLADENYSDESCFGCVESYGEALKGLKKGKGCDKALLVGFTSTNLNSAEGVRRTFSCLWDETEFEKTKNEGGLLILHSKELLAVIIVAALLVLLTPPLFIITRKVLKNTSDKEMEDLSEIVIKRTLEDESRRWFNCSDLYLFSQEEVTKFTENFQDSNVIGEGILGKTYVGVMPGGMKAAIKRFKKGIKLEDFVDHARRRAKLRHPNLVSLLGYSDGGDQCLVYEYCANGNLESWLMGGKKKRPTLTWKQRLQITCGIARGLWFLHNNALERMVHGDIKLANILLTEKLEAKLSDSMISRTNIESQATSDDVFNFGVVLLQLLSGRKAETLVLVEEARHAIRKGRSWRSIADQRLAGAFVGTEFEQLLSTAVLCTAANVLKRPTVEQVLRKVEEICQTRTL